MTSNENISNLKQAHPKEYRFSVAFSFPGEKRDYVRQVDLNLCKVLKPEKVFFDERFEAEIIGFDSDIVLQKIYHEQAELIVVFLCNEYEQKEWCCNIEWRAIRDLIKKRHGQNILPLRFDHSNIPGVYSIDICPDISTRTPEQTSELIIERLRIIHNSPTKLQSVSPMITGEASGSAQVKGVELNIYSYFRAAPANLRRSFDVLMSDKLRNFVGRQFVFDSLDEFIKNTLSGYFVIRGQPGIGKTALMAKLVNDRGYIHHFNVASQNIRSTRTFLENICVQLIARYGLPHVELSASAYKDSGFFLQCLSEAAGNSKNHPIVIAIDSLDEVDRFGLSPGVNILYLPPILPKGVYIVVATRIIEDLHLQVMQQKTLDIAPDSKWNIKDIDTYILNFVKRDAMRVRLSKSQIETQQFVETLRKKSQGNFMYLYYVLPAIESGIFSNGTLRELPDGLKDYYRRHWRQMRDGREMEFEKNYAPIVCVLGAAQESVTIEMIAKWTKLSPVFVKNSIGIWREFLEQEENAEGNHLYRVYHTSFQEFLTEEVDPGLKTYHAMIANSELQQWRNRARNRN